MVTGGLPEKWCISMLRSPAAGQPCWADKQPGTSATQACTHSMHASKTLLLPRCTASHVFDGNSVLVLCARFADLWPEQQNKSHCDPLRILTRESECP